MAGGFSPSRLVLAFGVAAMVSVLSSPPPAGAASSDRATANFRPFAPDSIWNQALRDDKPLQPESAKFVGFFAKQVRSTGAYVNTYGCGSPTFWASPDTPRVAVSLVHPSYADPALIEAWRAVPMPADAAPANCTDRNFAVLQRQPDGTIAEWEFFNASKDASGDWSASWGGAIRDVQSDRGIASAYALSTGPKPAGPSASKFGWNVSASSMSVLGGVITLDDMRRRRIDHAVAININGAALGRWLWPAQRTDGSMKEPYAIPEGAHLRVDPSLDLGTLKLTPLARMIAEAAQRYGIVVRDTTGNVNTFVGEEAPEGITNPVAELTDGENLQQALAGFPWARLQLLASTMCSGYSKECVTPETAALAVDDAGNGSHLRLDTRNSVLNQPRAAVAWDLDGNGTFETAGARQAIRTVRRDSVGDRVGVRIATRAGSTVTVTTQVIGPSTGPPVCPASGSLLGKILCWLARSGVTDPLSADRAASQGAPGATKSPAGR
jgi:hypothetical protein